MFIVNGLFKAGFKVKFNKTNNQIKVMKISKKIKSQTYTFNIFDSYLKLNSSLARLAKDFNVTHKSVFPYKFPNINNLNYVGDTPNIKFYANISQNDYNEKVILSSQWSLRQNTLDYLYIDLRALHEVLIIFSELIYDNGLRPPRAKPPSGTALNITNIPTMASLAYKTY